MNYLDGFRDPDAAAHLRGRLVELGEGLAAEGRRVRIMEVCGTHTMAIARHGVRGLLPAGVELISGPGCPVCVTETGYIDAAIELADRGVTIATFGDLLRVPGSRENLAVCRARGGRVEICFTLDRALELAEAEPERAVVFLAIGFETTVAPVVSTIAEAARRSLDNLTLLTAFKTVPPALGALLADPEVEIDAFLCPAHVSVIIGADAFLPFTGEGGVPCVIAGFEPLDILYALVGIIEQSAAGRASVDNQYSRAVRAAGNRKAQSLMEEWLEPVDAGWRGLGVIPSSGLALRREKSIYDAAVRHGVVVASGEPHPACGCGDVLKGKLAPTDCPLFDRGCTPSEPIGPCMVSSEGSCAAAFTYQRGV